MKAKVNIQCNVKSSIKVKENLLLDPSIDFDFRENP